MNNEQTMNNHDDPPPRVFPESLLAWKNGWSEMDETKQAFSVVDEEEFLPNKWATVSRTRSFSWRIL
jgi:hypothetical protein